MQVFRSWGLKLFIHLPVFCSSRSYVYRFGSTLLLPGKAGSVLPSIPALGRIPSAKLSSEVLLSPFSPVLILSSNIMLLLLLLQWSWWALPNTHPSLSSLGQRAQGRETQHGQNGVFPSACLAWFLINTWEQ